MPASTDSMDSFVTALAADWIAVSLPEMALNEAGSASVREPVASCLMVRLSVRPVPLAGRLENVTLVTLALSVSVK